MMEELQKEMKKALKKKRYMHTLGVCYTAQAMAMCFGEDVKMAGYAGMLHDCVKCFDDEKLLKECKKHGISITSMEKKNPFLLHAKLGAWYAKNVYGIAEEKVCSAIRWHTTGKPDMTDFEKIIYIADYIEPGRKPLPRIEEIRQVSFRNLNKAMYLILENCVAYLQEENKENLQERIDSHTMDAYAYYKLCGK